MPLSRPGSPEHKSLLRLTSRSNLPERSSSRGSNTDLYNLSNRETERDAGGSGGEMRHLFDQHPELSNNGGGEITPEAIRLEITTIQKNLRRDGVALTNTRRELESAVMLAGRDTRKEMGLQTEQWYSEHSEVPLFPYLTVYDHMHFLEKAIAGQEKYLTELQTTKNK